MRATGDLACSLKVCIYLSQSRYRRVKMMGWYRRLFPRLCRKYNPIKVRGWGLGSALLDARNRVDCLPNRLDKQASHE